MTILLSFKKYFLLSLDAFKILLQSQIRPKRIDVLFILSEANVNTQHDGQHLSRIFSPCISALPSWLTYRTVFWINSKTSKTNLASTNLSHYLIFRTHLIHWYLRFIFRPSVIVSIPVSHHLRSTANSYGITTIEPFHGFGISPTDYMWSVSSHISTGNMVTIYDDQTFATFAANSYKYYEAIRCRHPYLDLISHYPDKTQPNKSSHSKPTVLVTLQFGYDGTKHQFSNILDNGIMYDFLVSTIQNSPQYHWVIKPHPVQMASPILSQKLFTFLNSHFSHCPNVSFRHTFKHDPMHYLRQSFVHITMMSSTITEAALIGLPSIGLCPTLQTGGIMENAFQIARVNSLLILPQHSEEELTKHISQLYEKYLSSPPSFTQFAATESQYPSLSDVLVQTTKANSIT